MGDNITIPEDVKTLIMNIIKTQPNTCSGVFNELEFICPFCNNFMDYNEIEKGKRSLTFINHKKDYIYLKAKNIKKKFIWRII
jgi:hypothetical protein